MRGLVRKDLYLAWKIFRYILLLAAVYLAVTVFVESLGVRSIFSFYIPILLGTIPVSTYNVDEQSRWTTYSLTLPYSRTTLASSKYVLCLIFTAGCEVLVLISWAVNAVRGGTDAAEFMFLAAVTFAAGTLPTAVLMPSLYALRTARGRGAYLIVVTVIMVELSFFSVAMANPDTVSSFTVGGSVLSAAIFAAVYAVSWAVAVRFYKKRSF